MVLRKVFIRFLKISLFVVIAFEVEHFCHKKTGGFSVQKIVSSLPFHEEWKTAPPNQDIRTILDQPFTFYGKGAQCYVFLSADQKYVLKFCRFDHLRPPFWVDHLPLPFFLKSYRQQKISSNLQKISSTFESYKIAFQDLQEETGLVYVHLNPSDHLKMQTRIIDKLGIAHSLEMDSMQFILQKRADLVYPTIENLMNCNQHSQAKQALSDLVHLLAARSQKGIADKDPDIPTNFGFLDNHPVQIDIGRFSKRNSPQAALDCKQEIIRITDPFDRWLKKHYPELSIHLQEEIRHLFQEELWNG